MELRSEIKQLGGSGCGIGATVGFIILKTQQEVRKEGQYIHSSELKKRAAEIHIAHHINTKKIGSAMASLRSLSQTAHVLIMRITVRQVLGIIQLWLDTAAILTFCTTGTDDKHP
jgi:hypothetical protein